MRYALLGLMIAVGLVGCRGRYAMRCEDPERYDDSGEIPPVRVPDDLSVPDETDALRIPQAGQLPIPGRGERRGPCLESPPAYFEGDDGQPAAAPDGAESSDPSQDPA